MPVKPRSFDRDHAVELYRQGMSLGQVARQVGVSWGLVRNELIRRGIPRRSPRGRTFPQIVLPDQEIVRRFTEGESVLSLARSFRVSRAVIVTRLRYHGVSPRGRSDAEALKWSRMSPERRAAQVVAAHAAVRGSIAPGERKVRLARTRQRLRSHRSLNEDMIRGWLEDRGLVIVPQQAVGHYNCDLGAFPVAVEIWSGNWHFAGKHARATPERFRYLLDRGWSVLVVLITRTFPLSGTVADQIVAYVKQARSQEAPPCEYRMIGGGGQFLAAGGPDDVHRAAVYPRRGRRDPGTGRYEGIAS